MEPRLSIPWASSVRRSIRSGRPAWSKRLACSSQAWRSFRDDDEGREFVTVIAANPEAGDVVSETGGARKVRSSRPGNG